MYSSDNNYTSIVGVSITSLLENNKEFTNIYIYFIDCGLTEESKKILLKLVKKYNRIITFHPLKDVIVHYEINAPKPSYYGRLFAPFITKADKILYLDCDLLIVDSLKELWNTNIKGYSLAAVQGPGASAENRAKLNITPETRYINSGMLLINLNYWRKYNITEKLIDYLNRNGEIPPYHDQNIINAVCYRDMLIIHPKYNLLWSMMCCKPKDICRLNKIQYYYNDKEIENAINHPVIIHFSNSIYGRPWRKGCHHKYKKRYLYYKQISPWRNEPLLTNQISLFRKIRNMIYRCSGSKTYYFLQVIERIIIKRIIPYLPFKHLTTWIKTYMNGN